MTHVERPKTGRRGPMTAEELLRQLEADPEWVAKRDARDAEHRARAALLAEAELPLVADLARAGVPVSSVWDLVNTKARYDAALPVLVSHLERQYPDAIIEGIARALAVPAAAPFAWQTMLTLFRRLSSGHRAKQGAAVALANMTNERTIRQVVEIALDDEVGDDRILLVSALARFAGPHVDAALQHPSAPEAWEGGADGTATVASPLGSPTTLGTNGRST